MQYCIDLTYYYADFLTAMFLLAVLLLWVRAYHGKQNDALARVLRHAKRKTLILFCGSLPFLRLYSFIPYTALILWLLGVSHDDLMVWCFGLFFLFSFWLVNALVIPVNESDDWTCKASKRASHTFAPSAQPPRAARILHDPN
jgi:di/tricarboxylate transporter